MNTLSKTLSLSAMLVLLLAGCSSQQQTDDTCPSCNTPKVEPVQTTKPAPQPTATMAPVAKPAVKANRWAHGHPANKCTKSIKHTHKYKNSNHSHKYSCQGKGAGRSIDVEALQRKLKAKGLYKGPINGVINPDTRSALQRYQQRRN